MELTEEQIARWKKTINDMGREDMCRLHRFAPSGHPCFIRDTEVANHFTKRFDELGGFSPEISKRIGW